MPALLNASPTSRSAEARARLLSVKGEPTLLADWSRVVFIHFEVEPAILQREVPFDLELHHGRAYVSLVCFTVLRLRLRFGGRIARALFRPFLTRELFNVRTYVREGNETGIFFLAEWMTNRLVVPLAPITYGLPYRYGRLHYENHPECGRIFGEIRDGFKPVRFSYESSVPGAMELAESIPGSVDEFLLEQYSAFTQQGRRRRFYRVWHEPWLQTSINLQIRDQTLLEANWPWFKTARLAEAHYTPGVMDVWIGRPMRSINPRVR
ncbi:MAG: DUF2071 domain-containing protein [Verrucomicrobiota bacterium]|jgi:uncharacterized protein